MDHFDDSTHDAVLVWYKGNRHKNEEISRSKDPWLLLLEDVIFFILRAANLSLISLSKLFYLCI